MAGEGSRSATGTSDTSRTISGSTTSRWQTPGWLAENSAMKQAGVAANTRFEVAPAKAFPGKYDLVAFFDCLHDMGDPAGAAKHVPQALKPDGTSSPLPMTSFRLISIRSAASTTPPRPSSVRRPLSQDVGLGLGAQAGEARLRKVVASGGFTRFRRAAETQFNMVLEARP